MDRATENLILRTSGAFALAALLIHAGTDLGARAWPALYLVPFFVVAVAANWALARLNVKRPALWATAVLLGLVPAVMPLLRWGAMGADATYDGVLVAGAAFGAITFAFAANALRTRPVPAKAATKDGGADSPAE